MKKIMFATLVTVAAVCAAFYTNQTSAKSSNLLALANIEALTDVELDYDNCCEFTGDFKNDACYPTNGPVLYGYRRC